MDNFLHGSISCEVVATLSFFLLVITSDWYIIPVFDDEYCFHFCCRPVDSPIHVRLVGGTAPNKGRVEVYRNGFWGTICNNGWDIPDASVVCRMLGYPGAWTAGCCTEYPGGTGPVWLNDLSCTGHEKSLTECGHSGWGINKCNHEKDAEVVCYTPPTEKQSQNSSVITMIQASPSRQGSRVVVSSTPAAVNVTHSATLMSSWSFEAFSSSVFSPSSSSLIVLTSPSPTMIPGKKPRQLCFACNIDMCFV